MKAHHKGIPWIDTPEKTKKTSFRISITSHKKIWTNMVILGSNFFIISRTICDNIVDPCHWLFCDSFIIYKRHVHLSLARNNSLLCHPLRSSPVLQTIQTRPKKCTSLLSRRLSIQIRSTIWIILSQCFLSRIEDKKKMCTKNVGKLPSEGVSSAQSRARRSALI